MNILGFTRQHKIASKSGRKFFLKFSPQANFNFVQPCRSDQIASMTLTFDLDLLYGNYSWTIHDDMMTGTL